MAAPRTRSPDPIQLPPGVEHGSLHAYNLGCGCDACLKRRNAWVRERRHKRKGQAA